jgi:hypothetical protein
MLFRFCQERIRCFRDLSRFSSDGDATDRDEGTALGVEPLDETSEVDQRAGQPVDLVDHHHADAPGIGLGQKPLQGGTIKGAPRQTTIIEAVREGYGGEEDLVCS